MSQLNGTSFANLYGTNGTTFPDNTTGEISDADVKAFGQDIKDSYLNKTDGGTVTGNLGIGVSPASTYQLDAQGTAGANIRVTNTGTQEASVAIARTGGTASSWGLYLPISSTDLRFFDGTADRFTFSTAGIGTAADWIATSDRRLKNNIRRINDDVLDKIKKIGAIVSTYERIGTGKKETGFIAQELLEIAPEYVNVPDDPTEMMGVNYAKMTALLFKGIEQLMSK